MNADRVNSYFRAGSLLQLQHPRADFVTLAASITEQYVNVLI
jgi:hypothetical protein